MSDDAVNMFYFLKAKSTVRACSSSHDSVLQRRCRRPGPCKGRALMPSDVFMLPIAVSLGHMDDKQRWESGANIKTHVICS